MPRGKSTFAIDPAAAVEPLAGPLHRPRRRAPQRPAHFETRDQRRSVGRRGAPQDRQRPVGRHRRRPERTDHVRRLRGALAGQQAGRRPTDQGPHPRALPARSSTTICCRRSGTANSPRSSRRTSATGTRRHSSTGRRCARTPTRCCARSWRPPSTTNSSTPTRRASSAPAAPSASTRSGPRQSTSSPCSPKRCPNGCN